MQACRLNAAIMISGRGSNMQALVRASKNVSDFPVIFTHVLSDQPDAPGLAWARTQELTIRVVTPNNAKDLIEQLAETKAQMICLAGYMRILPPEVVQQWRGRMLNIHPSLLPKHKGLGAQAKALKAGDKSAGASVHFVTEELDGGELIEQEAVPIAQGESVESLSRKILNIEHQIYPKAVARVASQLLQEKQGQ